jgi:hypothetical protein
MSGDPGDSFFSLEFCTDCIYKYNITGVQQVLDLLCEVVINTGRETDIQT